MRLKKKPGILQVGHYIANRSGAKRFLKPLGNSPRRHRLTRLNVRAHDVRQYLAIPAFLERSIPHISTLHASPVKRLTSYILGIVSSTVNVGIPTALRVCLQLWPLESLCVVDLRALQLVRII